MNDVVTAHETTTDRPGSPQLTPMRTIAMALAGIVAFGIGVYVGLFVNLSLTGFPEVVEWQFELATVTGGTLAAALATGWIAPRRRLRAAAAGTALMLGAAAFVVVQFVDGDLERIAVAGAVVAAGATVAAWVADR